MKRILSLILLCPFALNATPEKLISTASLIDVKTKAALATCTMSWLIEDKQTFTPDENTQKIIAEWNEHGAGRGDCEGYELILTPEFFDFFRNKARVKSCAHIIKKNNDGVSCQYVCPASKDLAVGILSTHNLSEHPHPDGEQSPWFSLALVIKHLTEE